MHGGVRWQRQVQWDIEVTLWVKICWLFASFVSGCLLPIVLKPATREVYVK